MDWRWPVRGWGTRQGCREGHFAHIYVRNPRPHPVSEQLLSKIQPRQRTMKVCFIFLSLVYIMCGYYNAIVIAFMSIIQAAINDLVQLINNLGLQARLGTPDMALLRPSPLSTIESDTSGS